MWRAALPLRPITGVARIWDQVSEAQFKKIQTLIQPGMDEGARLVAGGSGRPDGLYQGYFVRPTLSADVTRDMTIARGKIFGHVLSIIPFEDEAEALSIANDTDDGLTDYVHTADAARAHRPARGPRAGTVEINGNSRRAGAPFGGLRQSGNGRERGVWGLEEFLEVKPVNGWSE